MNELDKTIILMNETKRAHKTVVSRWCNGDSSEKVIRVIQKLNTRWHRLHRKALQLGEKRGDA